MSASLFIFDLESKHIIHITNLIERRNDHEKVV